MSDSVPQPVLDWIQSQAPTNEFAASLLNQYNRKGELSVRQVAAVMKIVERVVRPVEQLIVDDTNLYGILYKAIENGVTKPSIRLGVYKFKMANNTGNNAGAIWVTSQRREANGEAFFFGKIKNGVFYPSEGCTREDYEDIREEVAHPLEGATAFGRRTGICCVCGRQLTKGESIDKMIGPICAQRFGL